jgi:hypothetical protein
VVLPVIADSNWLLSTAVQSAAALVAIVGGLLVTRLITAGSERNNLKRREDELRGSLDHAEAVHDSALTRLVDADFELAWWRLDDAVFTAHGRPNSDELRDRAGWQHSAASWQERLTARAVPVEAAFDFVESHAVEASVHDLESDELEAQCESPEVRDYVDAALTQLRKENPLPRRPGLAGLRASVGVPSRNWAAERARFDRRVEQAEEDAEQARREKERLQVQLAVVTTAAEATSSLQGVGEGLAVLAYLACVGVVLPLSLMANGAYELPPALRVVVVIAFASALVLFFRYLARVACWAGAIKPSKWIGVPSP